MITFTSIYIYVYGFLCMFIHFADFQLSDNCKHVLDVCALEVLPKDFSVKMCV